MQTNIFQNTCWEYETGANLGINVRANCSYQQIGKKLAPIFCILIFFISTSNYDSCQCMLFFMDPRMFLFNGYIFLHYVKTRSRLLPGMKADCMFNKSCKCCTLKWIIIYFDSFKITLGQDQHLWLPLVKRWQQELYFDYLLC